VGETGDTVNASDLQRLLERRRRQDPRKPAGEHRLSHPWRPDHQQVMAPGGRDLQRAPGIGLAPDVGEVELTADRLRRVRGRRRRWPVPPLQQGGDQRHRGHAQHLDPLDQRGLGGVLQRHDQALVAGLPSAGRERDRTRHRPQLAAQRQLAADRIGAEAVPGDLPRRRQQRDGEREVEAGAGLADVGRRQVRGQPLEWELETGVEERRADALARLADRRVREADDGEGRQAAADVDLDRDLDAVDALDRECCHACEHVATLGAAGAPAARGRYA
jgi:hypothetical protein